MLPPGRRRPSAISTLSLLALAFVLFSSTASAASAVLGVDLGTEYIKAALIKHGTFEIVLSKDSKRKEASAIAFKPARKGTETSGSFPERLYGGDALALAARFPGDVYPNLKPLLGLSYEGSPAVDEYKQRYPALGLTEVSGRGTVGFKSSSFSEDAEPFSVEELLAMELVNKKKDAELMAKSAVDNVVFTIPTFYTAAERRALELAAELAGLNVMSMISDGMAVGLNYATTKTFGSVNEGAKPEHHLIFDMGAGSTTATVMKFQGRTVKDVGRYNKTIQEIIVLGNAWDKSLGGDALNARIIDDMVSKFAESKEAQQQSITADAVKAHGRTAAKLWKDAERLRQVLSANTQTSAFFEGLYEDVDFKYKLTRTEFDEMNLDFANRLCGPVKQALETAKLSYSDLDSVILHGGATRTPFIQKALESLVGDPSKIRSNVNADEAAAFGSAFKGAGLSPAFKVKEIKDLDVGTYAAGIKHVVDGKGKQQKLFTPTSVIGAAKQVSFKDLEDFSFSLFQQVPRTDGSLVDQPVLKIDTKNLTESVSQLVDKKGCNREDVETKFSLRLSPINGLPQVVSGSVSCEVDEKKGGAFGWLGFGKKDKGDQEVLSDDDSAEASVEASSASSSSSDASSSKTSSSKGAEKSPAPPKKQIETINIAFTSTPEGLKAPPMGVLLKMKDRLKLFDKSDNDRRQRETYLNNLEAFTYRTRDLLEQDTFIAVSNFTDRASIFELLEITSAWLSGDGANAESKALKERFDELTGMVNPILKRREETASRPQKISELEEALGQTSSMIKLMREQIEETEAASSRAEKARSGEAAASSATPSPDAEADPLADMDQDEKPTTTTSASNPLGTLLTPYTQSELDSMTSTYDEVSAWLSEKIEEQKGRREDEDAAMGVKELEAKAEKLRLDVKELMNKKMQEMRWQSAREAREKASRTKAAKAAKKSKEAAEKKEKAEAEGSEEEESDGSSTVTLEAEGEEATPVAGKGDKAKAKKEKEAKGKKGKAKAKAKTRKEKEAKAKKEKGKKDKEKDEL
ncbi:actin-like ATPase domain-containing protein [Aulographum hederae CBS 113979]|uniref:Actin-like ATPase domain-containing protein n=1 Tax=Aulographum hederae CBS 113979 TaxID=1176131 RepID=A0A6G1H0U7_9PEZI|nr:actin-like ATPase domain-containing protein [Aulographum hederae CBS 113979]